MDSKDHLVSAVAGDGELLTLSEVAVYLKVAEKTVSRMLRRGEIPAVKVANQWRFVRPVLQEWLMSGMRGVAVDALDELRPHGPVPHPLSRAVPDGCILTGLTAEPKARLLERLLAPLAAAGVVADARACLAQVLAREQMVSTALGGGVALPHARDPVAVAGRDGVAIGISPDGIPFAAADGAPVHVIVLVCADSVPRHLERMAQVAMALRDKAVMHGLREARQACDVVAALVEFEQRLLLGGLAGRTRGGRMTLQAVPA